MRFNALRVLLITVHVFCLLTCVWFVVMLCILMALLVLLVVGRQSAVGALDFVQTAEKVRHTHASILMCSDMGILSPGLLFVAIAQCSKHAHPRGDCMAHDRGITDIKALKSLPKRVLCSRYLSLGTAGWLRGCSAVQNANTFTSDIFVRIEEYEKSLTNMTATISGYCGSTGFCSPVITDTQVRFSLQPHLCASNFRGCRVSRTRCMHRGERLLVALRHADLHVSECRANSCMHALPHSCEGVLLCEALL